MCMCVCSCVRACVRVCVCAQGQGMLVGVQLGHVLDSTRVRLCEFTVEQTARRHGRVGAPPTRYWFTGAMCVTCAFYDVELSSAELMRRMDSAVQMEILELEVGQDSYCICASMSLDDAFVP